MYKFVVISGNCGQPYDVGQCESTANKMAAEGYEFVQAYQTVVQGCGGKSSSLVMVFKQR